MDFFWFVWKYILIRGDGSEIRDSTVEAGIHSSRIYIIVFFHYLQGFIHPRWLFGISEPSTVCIKTSDTYQNGKSENILVFFYHM